MLVKGFVRVIEAILLSLVLISFFLPNILSELPKHKAEDWDEVSGYLICSDLLSSLDVNNSFDYLLTPNKVNPHLNYQKSLETLNNITKSVFPAIVDFEYEIKNVPNYSISVGVDSSCALPDEIFEPNYPPVRIYKNLHAIPTLFSNNYSTYIICGNVDLSMYKNEITNLLNRGKGIVLIRDFSFAPDSFTREIFQIEYTAGGISSGNIIFRNLSNPNTVRIAKRFINNIIRVDAAGGNGSINLGSNSYFFNILPGPCINISGSGCPCLHESDSCALGGANITIYQISAQWFDMKISSSGINKRNYIFSDTYLATVKANKYTVLSSFDKTKSLANARILEDYALSYETEPRVFWMYNFDKTKDDLKLLLKTAIIWTSGEHFFIFNKNIPKNAKYCEHYYSGLNNNNIPFIVKLFYWGY